MPCELLNVNLLHTSQSCKTRVSGLWLFNDKLLGGVIKPKTNIMENSFYDRLLIEAQELATKTNALNDFMRTQGFVDLDRQNKDLLYTQSRLMNEYLQVLGQRLEILGDKFSFKK
jgi:hypothetical protein